jgi:DNA polymerase I-like protein with 3'-5' exonuclease and polymerase domains
MRKHVVFLVGVLDRNYIKTGEAVSDDTFKIMDDVCRRLDVSSDTVVAVPHDECIGDASFVKMGKLDKETGKFEPPWSIRNYRDDTINDIRNLEPDIVVACGPLALKCLMNKGNVPVKEHLREELDIPELSGIVTIATHSFEQIAAKPGMEKWLALDLHAAIHGQNDPKWGKYTVMLPKPLTKKYRATLKNKYKRCPGMKFTSRYHTIPKELKGVKEVGLDLETYPGFDPHHPHARIRMAVVSDRIGRAWVVQATPDSGFPQWLLDMCADPAIIKGGSNIKFDYRWMARFGYEVNNIFDTSTAEHVLDPTNPLTNLKSLAFLYTELADYSRGHRKLVDERGGWEFIDDDEQYDYCGGDGEASIGAMVAQRKALKKAKLWSPFQLSMELYQVLAQMETDGACVSMYQNKKLDREFEKGLATLRQEITEVLGPINPNSVPQLAEALYRHIPDINLSKAKTARQLADAFYSLKSDKPDDDYSTDKATLEREASKHPIINTVLVYRRYARLQGTYVRNFREDHVVQHFDDKHYVHTSYRTDVVETYRLSSQEPNLQNIPRKPEPDDPHPIPDHLNIKKQYVSRFPKGRIIEVDLSQAEIRVAAQLSQDPAMLEALGSGIDLHRAMAALALQTTPESITALQRTHIKKTTFGIMYGAGAKTLGLQLGISKPKAGELLDTYFGVFTGLKACINEAHDEVQRTLMSESMFGYRRKFKHPGSWTDWGSKGWGIKRMAWNHKVQNPAACITYLGQIAIYNELVKQGAQSKLVLQVHDSAIIDATEDEWKDMCVMAKHHMENPDLDRWGVEFTVPLKADVEVGTSWGTKKEFDVL